MQKITEKGIKIYFTIIASTPRTAQPTTTAIASTNTTNSPNGAKLNIVVTFMVSIFFIAYANIVNTFDFYKFSLRKLSKTSHNNQKIVLILQFISLFTILFKL